MAMIWSAEIPFAQESIKEQVPDREGVYQILQSSEYQRYEGKTRVLEIGKSERGLKKEMLNHFSRHTAANRLARVGNRPNTKITIIFAITPDGSASMRERELLRQFEDKHWDLPVLNSQRGYSRDEDTHYKHKQE